MGQWGFKSYEGDDAADALDDAFESVHGDRYEQLMDDRNPMTIDQIHKELVNPATLAAAIEALHGPFGEDLEAWDQDARLAYAGIVVRHAELGVAVPEDVRVRALDWLEHEEIDWEEATTRDRQRRAEIDLLRRVGAGPT